MAKTSPEIRHEFQFIAPQFYSDKTSHIGITSVCYKDWYGLKNASADGWYEANKTNTKALRDLLLKWQGKTFDHGQDNTSVPFLDMVTIKYRLVVDGVPSFPVLVSDYEHLMREVNYSG